MAFTSVLPRSPLVAILFAALLGRAFTGEAAERPELESNASAWEAAPDRDHETLPGLALNSSAGEAAHSDEAPSSLAPLASGGAGPTAPSASLAASSLRGSLRGTRCICSTTDPTVLRCVARYTEDMDCFWDCEQACAKQGFTVKQCADSTELPGVADC